MNKAGNMKSIPPYHLFPLLLDQYFLLVASPSINQQSMLHTVSSARSHHGAPRRSSRERRDRRNEQLAALNAAFNRIQLEPDADAGSSFSPNLFTVNRSSGRHEYEASEISEVSDTDTVSWSDYEGSTNVARRPRIDSPPAVGTVSAASRSAGISRGPPSYEPSETSEVSDTDTVSWSDYGGSTTATRRPRVGGAVLTASRSAGISRGPPSYEPSEISEVSDTSTVYWSDNEGSTPTPSNTRRPPATTFPHPHSRVVPAAIPRETFIPLSDINDSSAIQIILALIHDCLLAIDKLLHGRRPPSVFASRYRLLSLYIVENDVRALRYSAIGRLVNVREKTLFASREESDHEARRRTGRYEADLIQQIIHNNLREPCQTSFQELIRDINDALNNRSLSDRIEDLSERIRSFLRIRPFQDVAEFDTSSDLTPAREITMLHDIFSGLWAKASSGPSDVHFISLAADSRRTHYSKSSRMRHIRDLVLCRDILCGVLPGPSPLTMKGAYEIYLRSVLGEQRRQYRFWTVLSTRDGDDFENTIKDFLEERMYSPEVLPCEGVSSMMYHLERLYESYFSNMSTT